MNKGEQGEVLSCYSDCHNKLDVCRRRHPSLLWTLSERVCSVTPFVAMTLTLLHCSSGRTTKHSR
jgi:hypothetical protein